MFFCAVKGTILAPVCKTFTNFPKSHFPSTRKLLARCCVILMRSNTLPPTLEEQSISRNSGDIFLRTANYTVSSKAHVREETEIGAIRYHDF